MGQTKEFGEMGFGKLFHNKISEMGRIEEGDSRNFSMSKSKTRKTGKGDNH